MQDLEHDHKSPAEYRAWAFEIGIKMLEGWVRVLNRAPDSPEVAELTAKIEPTLGKFLLLGCTPAEQQQVKSLLWQINRDLDFSQSLLVQQTVRDLVEKFLQNENSPKIADASWTPKINTSEDFYQPTYAIEYLTLPVGSA